MLKLSDDLFEVLFVLVDRSVELWHHQSVHIIHFAARDDSISLGYLIEGVPHEHGVCVDGDGEREHVEAAEVRVDEQDRFVVAEELVVFERALATQEHHPVHQRADCVKTGQNLHLVLKPVLRLDRLLTHSAAATFGRAQYTLLTAPHLIVSVRNNRSDNQNNRLNCIDGDQGVDLPVIIFAIARYSPSLNKDVNCLKYIEREQRYYVDEKSDFGDTWVLKQDEESMEED